MQFKQLFDDDRAVSPVIGVILMVAITVILAAVIGTFVLGLGDQVQQTTPQAQFGFDTSNSTQNVTITHESGDSVSGSELDITATTDFSFASMPGDGVTSSTTWENATSTTTVSAGESVEINAGKLENDANTFDDQTIRVVYDNPDSDKTATLAKFEV